MGKILYSAIHDQSNQPKKTKKGRKGRRVEPSTAGGGTPIFAPGQRIEPTEEQRRQLRLRQLQAAVEDPDMIQDHRREYNVGGHVTHSEPRHLPPHPYGAAPGERRINTLPSDMDTELSEEEKALHLDRLRQQEMQQGHVPVRFAAVTGDNPALKKVGDQISQVNVALGNLKVAVQSLQQTTPNSQAAQHHCEQMLVVLNRCLQPWLKVVDDHAGGIVSDTKMEAQNQVPEEEEDDDHPLAPEEEQWEPPQENQLNPKDGAPSR